MIAKSAKGEPMMRKRVLSGLAALVLIVALAYWFTVVKHRQVPEWWPKHPSPEFQRAAQVIKPGLPETAGDAAANRTQTVPDKAYYRNLPTAWEFFGALSDEQIRHFRSARKVDLPVASLTATQRAALDRLLATDQDWLTELRTFGATEDLSNVEVTFDVRPSGIVRMMLRVRQPGGGMSPPLPVGLGHI
jgi:hypothetical protein